MSEAGIGTEESTDVEVEVAAEVEENEEEEEDEEDLFCLWSAAAANEWTQIKVSLGQPTILPNVLLSIHPTYIQN